VPNTEANQKESSIFHWWKEVPRVDNELCTIIHSFGKFT